MIFFVVEIIKSILCFGISSFLNFSREKYSIQLQINTKPRYYRVHKSSTTSTITVNASYLPECTATCFHTLWCVCRVSVSAVCHRAPSPVSAQGPETSQHNSCMIGWLSFYFTRIDWLCVGGRKGPLPSQSTSAVLHCHLISYLLVYSVSVIV